MSAEIIFEDRDFLAVDKPENIASIQERQPGKESLLDLLQRERGERPYVVHRLDPVCPKCGGTPISQRQVQWS